MNTHTLRQCRRCLVIGLFVAHVPVAFSAEKADSAAVVAASVHDKATDQSASPKTKLKKAEAELRELRTQLRHTAGAAGSDSPATTDLSVAARAVQMEKLLAKQREVASLRRQAEDPAARADRYALQEQLAAARTRDERQVILDRHVALQSALADSADDKKANR